MTTAEQLFRKLGSKMMICRLQKIFWRETQGLSYRKERAEKQLPYERRSLQGILYKNYGQRALMA